MSDPLVKIKTLPEYQRGRKKTERYANIATKLYGPQPKLEDENSE